MDLTELRRLVQLMLRADLSELELDDTKRDMGRGGNAGALPNVVQVVPTAVQGATSALGAPVAVPAAPGAAAGPPPGTEVFKSPIVGTFYRASSPDAEPFVAAGSSFVEGAVLCIIEAMKVMNEIRAEFRGEVLEVLAENGEPVEFGQPLFLIRKT